MPVDGSALAEAVLPLAESLAGHPGDGLRLIRVVTIEERSPAQDAEREEARAYLDRLAAAIRARGSVADVRWAVWDGEPEQVIINAAVRERATLIAMGTHGRSGLDRVRFGSVAESVGRHAPVPVLLVRRTTAATSLGSGPILVPLDGSRPSEAVLHVVERLAAAAHSGVVLLHVVEPAPGVTQAGAGVLGDDASRTADAEAYLAEVAARLRARGLDVSRSVRPGFPAEVIESTAGEMGPALIAMSTHGRTGLTRILAGSVAEHVARTAGAPVLLWKAPRGGSGEPA